MVQLVDSEIQTLEVLTWKGIHLLHSPTSSCSQKSRIFLALKGIEWQSHPIDLTGEENYSDWFLGINPRGLVPVLIHDGVVHIESNDILDYLEEVFPEPRLIPPTQKTETDALLRDENDLHLDLRTLTFRYMSFSDAPFKSSKALENFENSGTGMVGGEKDTWKNVELKFYHDAVAHGITDDAVHESANKFRSALNVYNDQLAKNHFLLADQLSLVDIAWFIYANRIILCGYPLHELHPRVGVWFDKLMTRPEFANEVQLPPALAEAIKTRQAKDTDSGTALRQLAGF